MEIKYQVFVSSTYKDLLEERQEVIQALLELDCIPVGMELFPATDDDQWTLIKRLIDDCDYYILIIFRKIQKYYYCNKRIVRGCNCLYCCRPHGCASSRRHKARHHRFLCF